MSMKVASFGLAFLFGVWILPAPGANAQSAPTSYEGTESITGLVGKVDVNRWGRMLGNRVHFAPQTDGSEGVGIEELGLALIEYPLTET